MILSNQKLLEALDRRWIIITPQPAPRPDTDPDTLSPYQTTAVDLRLGYEITYFREGLPFNIDLQRGTFGALFGPNSEVVRTTPEQPFSLHPRRLVLGQTLELVEFPIRPNEPCFAGRVEGKSSYARCGLMVHLTAPTIHAGFRGTITLELINVGSVPILLYPEMPICQLIVEHVDGQPVRNDSQFHGQTHPAGNP